ncbi:MAG: hypothetical protein Q9219_000906 [cf. Caloplaca sp. 3 TL-2023]
MDWLIDVAVPAGGQQQRIDPDTDLTVLLKTLPDSQSQVYTQALQLLEALKASPSCNRLAASALIDSCQSIDGSRVEAEGSIEDLKSLYAAQLAMCEVSEAGTKAPGPCEPLWPSKDFLLNRKLDQSSAQPGGSWEILKGELSMCLQSLESRPQHWTSYSNNRQNAVVMCQAARAHVEKENLVKLHQSMVDTTSGAHAALARAVAAANRAMTRQKEFEKEANLFQQQMMRDLLSTKTETQSYFGQVVKYVDTTLQGIVKHFLSKMKVVENEATNVEQALRAAAAEAEELKSNIGRVFQQVVEGNAEVAATQVRSWDGVSSSMVELRSSLRNLRETEVHSLLGEFGSIYSQLVG